MPTLQHFLRSSPEYPAEMRFYGARPRSGTIPYPISPRHSGGVLAALCSASSAGNRLARGPPVWAQAAALVRGPVQVPVRQREQVPVQAREPARY
jgi:hypothetical protein